MKIVISAARLLCLVFAFYVGVAIALILNAYLIDALYEDMMWEHELDQWEQSIDNIEPPPEDHVFF